MTLEELATKIALKITDGDEVPITVHSKSLISLTRGFQALVKCILEVLESQEDKK